MFPHQFSWLINNRLRRLIVSPESLVRQLPLTVSSRVLEVGPGSGYFSSALASAIPFGHLELFDIQPQMLAKAERTLRARGFQNFGCTLGDASQFLPFADGDFDAALLVSVLGEIADQDLCLQSLNRILAPTGFLAFHEAIPDPDRIPFHRLCPLVECHGFNLYRRSGPSWNYSAVFVKRSGK